MTIDRKGRDELPPSLESLHEELSSIEIWERPSFGPELEAELEQSYTEQVAAARKGAWKVPLRVAAVAAALAIAAAPQARASLVKLVHLGLGADGPAAPEQRQVVPQVAVREHRPVFVPEPAERSEPQPAAPVAWASEPITRLVPDIAYPAIRNEAEAEAIVALHYPPRLQRQGVGGAVRLILWVDEGGAVREHEIVRSSGVERLDRAALQAAPMLRFSPARRQAQPVGTWVEFDVQFRPPSQFRIPEAPVVADLADVSIGVHIDLDDKVVPPEPTGEGNPPPVVANAGNSGIRAMN